MKSTVRGYLVTPGSFVESLTNGLSVINQQGIGNRVELDA